MITTFEACEQDGAIIPRHIVQVLCPACERDVDEQELAVLRCTDCGHDLSEPKKNVAIHATSVPAAGGLTLGD